MRHEDISLTEWNDTADTFSDLEEAVRAHGRGYVTEALGMLAMNVLPTEEVQRD